MRAFRVAPNDILSNLFLEDLEKIWELRKWIPDPCSPFLHNLKPLNDGEDACRQNVTNECVDYWTRKGDGDTWRHKEHTYTTTENVGAVHTEWAEDCGIKRWFYESGLVGRAS